MFTTFTKKLTPFLGLFLMVISLAACEDNTATVSSSNITGATPVVTTASNTNAPVTTMAVTTSIPTTNATTANASTTNVPTTIATTSIPTTNAPTIATTSIPTTNAPTTKAATTGATSTTVFQAKYFSISVPKGWVAGNISEITPTAQIPYPSNLENVTFNNNALSSQYTVLYRTSDYNSLKADFDKRTWPKSGAIQAGSLSGIYGIDINVHGNPNSKSTITLGECILPSDAKHAFDILFQEPSGGNIDQESVQFEQFCHSLVPTSK